MSNEKFDLEFVKQNRDLIRKAAVSNARRLLQEGELLMNNGHFSRATHLFISGIEELAKESIIFLNPNLSSGDLKAATNHTRKLGELMRPIQRIWLVRKEGRRVIREQPLDLRLVRAQRERLSKMLEDTMYVRLKPTPKKQIEPDDKYWKKRAKSLHRTLKVLSLSNF